LFQNIEPINKVLLKRIPYLCFLIFPRPPTMSCTAPLHYNAQELVFTLHPHWSTSRKRSFLGPQQTTKSTIPWFGSFTMHPCNYTFTPTFFVNCPFYPHIRKTFAGVFTINSLFGLHPYICSFFFSLRLDKSTGSKKTLSYTVHMLLVHNSVLLFQ
jgi:hypothetical protein